MADLRVKTSERIDFRPLEIENLTNQNGLKMNLEKVVFCPCRRDDNSQPQSTCKICKGNGWIFMPKQVVYGMVTSLSFQQTMTLAQPEINATANLTLSENYDFRLNYFDRLTLLDGDGIIKNNLLRLQPVETPTKKEFIQGNLPYIIKSIECIYLYVSNSEVKLLEPVKDYTFFDNIVQFTDKMRYDLIKKGITEFITSVRYNHMPVYHVLSTEHSVRMTRVMDKGNETIKLMPLQYKIREASFYF